MTSFNFNIPRVTRMWLCVFMAIASHAKGAGYVVSADSANGDGDLAFVYITTNEFRLVVINEANHQRCEFSLEHQAYIPFWDNGRVYVINAYGKMQGFRVSSGRLVVESQETISPGAVLYSPVYNGYQRRLYLIRDYEDPTHRQTVVHDLQAIDFHTRKVLWVKRIHEGGLVRMFRPYVCVTGQKMVQVFSCDTGEELGMVSMKIDH
jgi:hypothetical protein